MTNWRRRFGGSEKTIAAAVVVGAALIVANQIGLFPTPATYNYGYYGYYGGGGTTPAIVTAPGAGGGPHVKPLPGSAFMAYPVNMTAGVRVARGELDPSTPNQAEVVTVPGPGAGPHVRVFAVGGDTIADFLAYSRTMTAGLFVATGNLDTDAELEIVTAPDVGAPPHIRAFNHNGTPLAGFGSANGGGIFAYTTTFTGGVRVAVGDLDGDGIAEIITAPGPGQGPEVKAFKANGTVHDIGGTGTLKPYDGTMTAGVFVAVGHLDDSPGVEIVTSPGQGAGPHVRVFNGAGSPVHTAGAGGFMAYPLAMRAGVTIAVADLDSDEEAELVTGPGPGAGPHIRVFDRNGVQVATSHGPAGGFMAYAPGMNAGVFVAAGFL